MIELDQVTKQYPDGTVAVGSLTLTVPTGTVTALVGSSGCGKTTTLRMINRMIEPTGGTIAIDGRDVRSLAPHDLRRGIGYVIQQAGLFPHRTVLDNVTTVPRLLGWSRATARQRALELLELVGLDPDLAARYPVQLSGGQQQRVGVARALAADPPVLLMDEPFGAVDPVQRGQLQAEFSRLQRELRKTVVFVTHDIAEAVQLADRVAVLGQGAVLHQHGTPQELLARPANDFVAGFLGADRRLTLLSLVPAHEVPVRPMAEVRAGPSAVWLAGAERVGPDASARSLLDASLASPGHVAVRVDGDGHEVGAVLLEDLTQLLDRLVAEAGEAGEEQA